MAESERGGSRLGERIALLANIGVFLGFLAVAWQLGLTRLALEASSSQASQQLFAAAEQSFMGEDAYRTFSKALLEPENITPAEMMQVWAYMSVGQSAAWQTWQDYQNGSVSQASWEFARDSFIAYIAHPVGEVWWHAFDDPNNAAGYQAFRDAIDTRARELPPNLAQQQFRHMIERVGQLQGPDA